MTTAATARPAAGEFAPSYNEYVAEVPDGDITRTLAEHGDAFALVVPDAGDPETGQAVELGALGEWAYGAGRNERNLAYIKVGSGVGAGSSGVPKLSRSP